MTSLWRRRPAPFRPRVEALEDRRLLATFVVTNTMDDGPGSLRQAIRDVNTSAEASTIKFQIDSGPQRIAPLSGLPTITHPVTIDGRSQPGFEGTPLIELDGVNAGNVNGITITAGNSTVRGLNIHTFNAGGIVFQMGGNNVVEGNYIGTDRTGTVALGDGGGGITMALSSNNRIGGTSPKARNVIAFNGEGIILSGGGNVIQGNYIGTDVTGTQNFGNRGNGIHVFFSSANDNLIGGTEDGAGNVIAYSGNDGVSILRGQGNGVLGNSIFSNGLLGIQLKQGGNHWQPAPELTSAVSDGESTLVTGTLASDPNTAYTLEFFANAQCSASGDGEGERLLGRTEVVTGDDGTADFSASFDTAVDAGQYVTATATDPGNNTSQFSACVVVTPPPTPNAVLGTALGVEPMIPMAPAPTAPEATVAPTLLVPPSVDSSAGVLSHSKDWIADPPSQRIGVDDWWVAVGAIGPMDSDGGLVALTQAQPVPDFAMGVA